MPIRVILFDLDDTLVIETPAVREAFLAACEPARERMGIDPSALAASVRDHAERLWLEAPEAARSRAIGMSSWEALWASFRGADPDERCMRTWAATYRREAWAQGLADRGAYDGALAEELSEAFRRERRARNAPFPEVEEVLSDLRASHGLGLVSNGVSDHQRDKLRAAGLDGAFEVMVFSGDLGVGKPDPRVFEAALAALGVRPGEAAMVGNSLRRDVAGAMGAGLRGIWINRAGVPRVDGIVPDAEIADLREVRLAIA
ncbi:MAG: HAD family hydrolase [Planctomycetes bacterium]|nr:HAD family hydrolase [Planctomycetota bacterium]